MPCDGIAIAVRPRRRAISRPRAEDRLLITTAISAGKRPAAMESAMASKLDPRPESKIPRRFTDTRPSHARAAALLRDRPDNKVRSGGGESAPLLTYACRQR